MRIDRRDWLLGAGGLLAGGAAFALTPRRHLDLMGAYRLDRDIPVKVGAWQEDPGQPVVMPPTKGSYIDQLYQQIFSRAYIKPDAPADSPIMLFSSYGSRQSDVLQLHRPEACYPAVGFRMTSRALTTLPIGKGPGLPVVALTMVYGDRYEDIIYWARIGDALPQDSTRQRFVRMEEALKGTVLDGLLMRLSAIRTSADPPLHGEIAAFARDMLSAVDPQFRPALIGRTYAADVA